MAKRKKNLSVTDLEQMLQQKMSQLEILIERRKKLQEQVAGLDAEIQSVAGISGRASAPKIKLVAKPKRMRRRSKNKISLSSVVREVLGKNKKGLTSAELEEAVLATGYKSSSKNFRSMIYQCLGKAEDIALDSETKRYKIS